MKGTVLKVINAWYSPIQRRPRSSPRRNYFGLLWVCLLFLAGCASNLEPAPRELSYDPTAVEEYRIGPLDGVSVNVWQAPEFSTGGQVRPDGMITLPLVEDVEAAGKTPQELARYIEEQLATFLQDPIVTVTVSGFSGPFDRRIRIVREGSSGVQAIPFRKEITLLDLMVEAGGLGPFDRGNNAKLIRSEADGRNVYALRIGDLLGDAEIDKNVPLLPGDIIVIPEAVF